MVNIETIIYYLFLLDSFIANILAWCCVKWHKKNYKGFFKHFPLTKAWAFLYFVLVFYLPFYPKCDFLIFLGEIFNLVLFQCLFVRVM